MRENDAHDETEYTVAEAAQLLGIAPTTLRDRCTRREVPHHRRHTVKGVYLTGSDISEIRALQKRAPPAARDDRDRATADAPLKALDAELATALALLGGTGRRSGQSR
jgi:hypothetical protein